MLSARMWFSIGRRYAPAPSMESMRVLVVEDEPYLAEAIRDGLRLEAIAADIAGDGDTALELLNINAYDIAVLDRDIPGPSGDEIAKRIVASGSGMPILMLTADDYLTKPFALQQLVLRLRALDRRRGHSRQSKPWNRACGRWGHEQATGAGRPLGNDRTAAAEGRPPPGPGPRLPHRDRLRAQGRPALGVPAPGAGLRLGDDLLAAAARLAGRRRPGAAAPGAPRPPRRGRPDRLEPGEFGQRQRPGQKGGDATGPDPTNRGKPGTKRHGVVDRAGTPLAVCLTGAN